MIDIAELCKTVASEVASDKLKRQIDLNQKRAEWCIENGKKHILTYHVKSELHEITITGKKGTQTTLKRYLVNDEDIIASIKLNAPEDITESIFWFDHGHYLFTTDKNIIYNLKKKPRPLTIEEENEVNSMKEELEEEEKALHIEKKNIDILLKGYRDGDESVLNNPQNTFLFLQYPNGDSLYNDGEKAFNELKELLAEYSHEELTDRMNNDEAFNSYINELNELTSYYTDPFNRHNKFRAYYEKVKSMVEEFNQKRTDFIKRIKTIYSKSDEECIYEIHPMSIKNQVKVYCSELGKEKYESYGYKVYKQRTSFNYNEWNESELKYEQNEGHKTSYYFIMNKKAFISVCKNGKMVRNGFYYDENGEVTAIEKGKEIDNSVTVIYNGMKYEFDSLRSASTRLKINYETLRKSDRNDLNEVVYNDKKNIVLINGDGERMVFKNKSEVAKKLDISKKRVTVAFNGLISGDEVTLNGQKYIIE